MASRVQRCSRATPPRCGVCSLVSIILFGSAASGAFSDSSDVDLIIVLPDEATPEDRRRLREVVSDLEITHSLRLPATRSKNPLEMFAEHAGGKRALLLFLAAEATWYREMWRGSSACGQPRNCSSTASFADYDQPPTPTRLIAPSRRQRLDRHVASAVQAGTLTPASTQKYSRLQTEVGSTDENLESARRIRFDHTPSCDKSAAVRKEE
jgi:predicted nucleotidyltransferase